MSKILESQWKLKHWVNVYVFNLFLQMHLPLGRAPNQPLLSSAFPSNSACCTCVWTPCNILQLAQRRHARGGIHTPHQLVPVGTNGPF